MGNESYLLEKLPDISRDAILALDEAIHSALASVFALEDSGGGELAPEEVIQD